MKNIKDLPHLFELRRLRIVFDGDSNDHRLHSDENFSWGAATEQEYNEAEKEIQAIKYGGNGWEIYAWYDVSGFNYWIKNIQEQNYIQLTIGLENPEVDNQEIPKLIAAFEKAINDVKAISNKHSFNPGYPQS